MLPIWLADAEDCIKLLLTDGLKNILEDTKYVASVVFVEDIKDENSDVNNEDSGN